VKKYSDEIVAIYGIGSYFDKLLPDGWLTEDVDIITVTKTRKMYWQKKSYGNYEVFFGFNTLEELQDEKIFRETPATNYKWAIMDFKICDNSELLYGEDISVKLPELDSIDPDYNDLLKRALYRVEKSLKLDSKEELTKAVFKYCFYVCVYLDDAFHYTSIVKIKEQVEQLVELRKLDKDILEILIECFSFRRLGEFSVEFHVLRNRFLTLVIRAISKGTFHAKMKLDEFIRFLDSTFNGCPNLKRMSKKSK